MTIVAANNSFDHKTDWFYEGQISKTIVAYLKINGYEIIKDNSEQISQHGADIIAKSTDNAIEIIEVKGYPSTYNVKGPNKGTQKKTNPKLQAHHWFFEAIHSCMKNYTKYKKYKDVTLSLGFPDDEDGRYRQLISQVEDFFTAYNINIKVYFVTSVGSVSIYNLCKKIR